jgi:hypothetical protein
MDVFTTGYDVHSPTLFWHTFFFMLACSVQLFVMGYVFGRVVRLVRAGLEKKHSGPLKQFDWKWFGIKLLKGTGIMILCFALLVLVDAFAVSPITNHILAAHYERFLEQNPELRELIEQPSAAQ